MRMEFLWLALIVVFAVIEGATTALTTVWFIGGALAALAAALLHAELWLQITLFFAVSVVLLAALRPLVKKLRPRTVRTNAAGNIGREAIVTEAIDNLHETGAVRLSGVEWTARSADGSPVAVGTVVRIDTIEGVKLIVTPVPVPNK